MKDFLNMALYYAYKEKWSSGETIWLVRERDPKREALYKTQGIFLSHHRMSSEVHLHCTLMKSNPRPSKSLLVFKLNEERTQWQVNPKLDEQYIEWCVQHGKELANIEYLTQNSY